MKGEGREERERNMLAGKLIEVRTPNWDPFFGRGRRSSDTRCIFDSVTTFCSHFRIILGMFIELFCI